MVSRVQLILAHEKMSGMAGPIRESETSHVRQQNYMNYMDLMDFIPNPDPNP